MVRTAYFLAWDSMDIGHGGGYQGCQLDGNLGLCKDEKLAERLRTGVINMTDYLTRHYSRFSSANNHLLVEAAAIGLAGYAFGYRPWKELGMALLSKELLNQNYEDGVNKELSCTIKPSEWKHIA